MDTLLYLANAYFHQDWEAYGATPLGVVSTFMREEPEASVVGLQAELRALLGSDSDEEALRSIWQRQGRAAWNPTTSGWKTYRAWLEDVLTVLDHRQ